MNDAAKAIDFYQRAFGARELTRMSGPAMAKMAQGPAD